MFQLKQIQANDVGTLNRVFQAIATALNMTPVPPQVPVKVIKSTSSDSAYSVGPQDVYLPVDSRGGPMRVSLPVPSRATQAVYILKAYDSNSVAVVQANGKPFVNAPAVVTLSFNETAHMVNDGTNWYRFNG